ncbi:MAG TPA: DUF6531 domain-containing protein, partial [Streptosporangiaceae bacterium]|nr:DUF6531 domain-containing protein [Streptosporangiaceae bacterium]
MGNPFDDLWNDTKQVVGTGLDDGAHLVGDGLNAAGLHGAAQAVDALGDQTGYHLGAGVPELQLGETSDPAELVHGDPGTIRSSASKLRTFSGAFGETASGLRGLDTAHWTGAAADAFRAKFAPHPAKWQDAASATSMAAGALESYAGAVESAQGQAGQAITLYEQGQQATATAQAAYNSQIAAYNSAAQAYNAKLASGQNAGTAPAEPGAFSDPGAAMRQQAAQILGDARSARDRAAASAAGAIRPATGLAPAEASFWSQVGSDFMDGMQVANLAGLSFAGGIVTGAADIVKFARTLDPTDQWNLEHPAEYVAGLSSSAAGLAEAGTDPGRLVQGLVGTGWGSDPFAAAGRLVPNIALAAGTDGAGTAADAGSSIAERAALGSGEDAGALSGLADDPELAAQPPGNTVTAGDPIDVVTGDVVLAAADLTLPGTLPLVVRRRHRSSWRAGRWFGPSWMSSFDQRLQVSGGRVIGVFDDGRVLVWPRPDGGGPDGGGPGEGGPGEGEPLLPVAGAPWPLRRVRGGGWTVTDPQRGLTWWFEPRDGYFRSADGDGELPLVAVADRAGHEISFGYDQAGIPAGIRHSGGYHVEIAVAGGRITALACGGPGTGGTTQLRYGYDADGNLAAVTNSSGEPLRYYYDGAGRLTGWQDRTGSGYTYHYDHVGRCVRGDGPDGALSGTVRYDPDAQITTWTDSSGAATTYHLDGAYVVAMTDPLGHLSRWQHDRRGHLTERTDPLGRVTRYGYDADGNLRTVTRPDGSQARADYDGRGLPLRLTDPAGHAWAQEYDERGHRISLTAPDGSVTRFGYDDHGHLASVTSPDGAITAVRCDQAGLPVELTGPDGARTVVERDPLGRVSRLTGPDGSVTELTWTAGGRPQSRVFADGTAEFWDYDADGYLTRHLTPAGGLTRYEYGPFGQVAAMTGPDGTRTRFRYDHGLRLSSVVHGGLNWSYEYDPAGRLVAETDYNGASTSYAHDPAGQLTSQVNACGQRVAFRHDQLGNVTERISGGATTTFGYDLAGHLVYARNPDAEVWLDRDPAGRITAETCNGRTMTSGYDAAGRRNRRATPFGAVSNWEYDAAGQPVRLTAGEHEIRFGYDRTGREIRRDLPGGLALAQDWDACGRLTLQVLTAGPAQPEGPLSDADGGRPVRQRRGYAYNCDGLITSIDDLLNGARTVSLDRSGRVTAVTGPDWAEQYSYDPAGNLTAADWPAPPGPAALMGADSQGPREVTGTLVTRAGNVRYRHDRQGRVVQRQVTRNSRRPDVWQYQWDAESRLVAVTTPDHTVWRYRYDPFGRRIAKQRLDPGGEVTEQTDFSWDGPVLAEQATTVKAGETVRHQVVSWDYRPGSFTPVTQAEHSCAGELSEAPQEQIDQRFYAIITDLVGTPAELIAPDGTLAGNQQHTLWGETQWRPGGAQSPLRFPGQYADPESGLHYNQHRYYDPAAGAYLTCDPLGLAPAPNPHAYVANP